MVMALNKKKSKTTKFNDLETFLIQNWWDTIQARNRYFFELIQMRLNYIETSDLYLLLLEMDDCMDDLDTVDCPHLAIRLRDCLVRAVKDTVQGLVSLSRNNPEMAQMFFNTARAEHRQVVEDLARITSG